MLRSRRRLRSWWWGPRKRDGFESPAWYWIGSFEPRNPRESDRLDNEEAGVALEDVTRGRRALGYVTKVEDPVTQRPRPSTELPGKRGGFLETRTLDVGDGNECPDGHAVPVGCGDGVMDADHEARVRSWW